METTSSNGFDPARNRAALKAFTERTGFTYIPDSKASQRRETSLLGLVALNDWARVSADQGKFEKAVSLFEVGLALAPEDRLLRHNRCVVGQQHISQSISSRLFFMRSVLSLYPQAHQVRRAARNFVM